MKRQFIATTAGVVLASLVAVSVAWADTPERLTAAADTVQSLLKIPETDKGIPQDLIKKAQCLVVVPSLKSAALGVGGEYGRGFVSCRQGGGWTAPAAVKVEGGSFGFQIGGSETEVVMLVMRRACNDCCRTSSRSAATRASRLAPLAAPPKPRPTLP